MSNKISKARVGKAVSAMADLGISEDKVKPVLKKLLKLFDRNWVPIEEENYRALADAIFDEGEEAESPQKINKNDEVGLSMNIVNGEEGVEEEPGELEQPLKRSRHKCRDGQTSSSHMLDSGTTSASLIQPKDEPVELPENLLLDPSGSKSIETLADPHGATSKSRGKNKGKQPLSHDCHPNSIISSPRNSLLISEPRTPAHSMRLRERGNNSDSSQIPSADRRLVPGSSPSVPRVKEPQIVTRTVIPPEQTIVATCILIKPKDEPMTDAVPFSESPCALTDPSNGGDSSCRNGKRNHGPEQSMSQLEPADSTASLNDPRNKRKMPIPAGAGVASTGSMNKSVGSQSNEQCQVKPKTVRSLSDEVDIAKGQEKVVITLVNEVDDEPPPSFFYIPKNTIYQNAHVNFSLARIGDDNACPSCIGDCLSLDTPCTCSYETGGEFAYTRDGLIKEDLLRESISMNRDPKMHCQFYCKECPLGRSNIDGAVEPCKGHLLRRFIKECWMKCGCDKLCGNRVVQRGITRKLQVFMSLGGKGWGLRTLEDLPKGAFVCEYVGEVLTNTELFERLLLSPEKEKHSYPVLLDADWGAEAVLKDEEALCLDATFYGNVARFINHRCYDSNMVEMPVEVETPDHHYYHLAFFTTRKVKAMEELTWDYGIDFDDNDHPIEAFQCKCGSKYCRNIKRARIAGRR